MKGTEKFRVVDIWLSDYLSMNDEITVYDLGQAMGVALRDQGIAQERHSFDAVVHSTGGLVIRQYLMHHFLNRPHMCPIRNLVMLAPANFGSPLAHIGKSMIGRLRLGWDWDHFLQTGTKVLEALELASPVSWRMAEQDLFNPGNNIFTPQHLRTTILTGTDSYDGMGRMLHENGSDGTVRVSTANLNASYLKLIFEAPKGHRVEVQEKCYSPVAFGVLYNHNHGTIVRPQKADTQLADTLVNSLSLEDPAAYERHRELLDGITAATFQKGQGEEKKRQRYHEYQHVAVRVHDQFGEGIKDYFLEFFQEEDEQDRLMQKVHSEILEKVHKCSQDESYRALLFDITDMKKEIVGRGRRLDMSLCAAALSRLISYHDPKDHIPVAGAEHDILLAPHTTLFVDIELPRVQAKEVFKLIKTA